MIQATCVYITQPTSTSAIDQPMFPPSRRRFLTIAAGASVVGTGSLAAAAMAPSVPAAVVIPPAPATAAALHDPVFGLIEAHRKADRDFDDALDEQNRLERIGDWAAGDLVGEAPLPCRV